MALQYRHGFKAEANWWSRELRREQKLLPQAPMCPRKLCEHLHLPLKKLSEFADHEPAAVAYLVSTEGQKEFSGVTIQLGAQRWIIYNDAHDAGRQASDIAHEVAHALLQHPVPVLFGADGKRNHDKGHEDEANWLGPALLVSDEAAVAVVASGMSIVDAAEIYGTSPEVMRMRINVSGARKRAAA
jgi:hypothetical protein